MSITGQDLKKKTKADLIAELQKSQPNPWLTSFYNFNLKALKWGSLAGASLIGLTAIMNLAKNNPELLKKVVLGLWENTQSLVHGGTVGFAVKFINSLGVWDLLEEYTGQEINPELKEATAKTLLNLAPSVKQIKPSLEISIPEIQMIPINDSDVSMGSGNSPAMTIDIPTTTSPLVIQVPSPTVLDVDMSVAIPNPVPIPKAQFGKVPKAKSTIPKKQMRKGLQPGKIRKKPRIN
jgi:hypothetical protein